MMRKWYYSEIGIISISIVLMLAIVGGSAFWYVQQQAKIRMTKSTEIRMPKSAEALKGENYQDVITLLETAGFTSIKTAILDDLVTGWMTKDGEVERVSVNGDTNFYSGSKFSVDAKIVVTYHTFPVIETKKTDSITPQTTTKETSTPSAAERTNAVVSKPAETKTRSIVWKTETYEGITFKVDSSWKKEIEDRACGYYPPISEPTGFIICSFLEEKIGNLSDKDARTILDGYISYMKGEAKNLKNTGKSSNTYFKIGGKSAARETFYSDFEGTPYRTDGVFVLLDDGIAAVFSFFPTTEYESYKDTIETTLSSVQLGRAANSSSPSSSKPSVITISAPAIVKEYLDNEVAADHKYKGKIVRMTAKIKDIGKDILGDPYITFSDGEEYSFRSVQCFFKKSEQAKIGTLRKGQTVTIDGTVDGLMMNVLLKDCVFKN
jgi:hypothetical protein